MIDRYKLLESLGEGGAGTVKKAWDKKLQRYVALKLLLPLDQREAGEVGTDLAAEAAALSALQHPNIVSVYDFDTDGDEPFVVMEYINGENLEQTVRRGALMPGDFFQVAVEALEGLHAAHKQGIAHRDIKPGNVMVHWLPNGTYSVKLLDFGLAKYSNRPAQQQVEDGNSVAGSVHFMAPEQFLHQPLDLRTDLYSLGCVFYYTLTGSYPFSGDSVDAVINAHLARKTSPLNELRGDIDPLLCDWVMFLMSRQQEERPDSAAEALRILQGIQSGELTALPSRRALRTKQLSTSEAGIGAGTGVISSPLNKDGAARAVAAKDAIHLDKQEAESLSARGSTLPQGLRHPAHGPAGPSAYSDEEVKKSRLPWIAAAAVLVVGGGLTAVFSTKPKLPKGSGGEASRAAADAPAVRPVSSPTVKSEISVAPALSTPAAIIASPPKPKLEVLPAPVIPMDGLVMWFSEASGIKTGRGRTDAMVNDTVDQWDDAGPTGGKNIVQYHKSTKGDWRDFLPTLVTVNDNGLTRPMNVLRFDGNNNLVVRDKDNVGDPIADQIDGIQLTWSIVFRMDDDIKREQVLLSAYTRKEHRTWSTLVSDGSIRSGVYARKNEENHVPLPINVSMGFHIVTVVWDGANDQLRQWLTTPEGTTTASPPIAGCRKDHGPVEGIRIGAATPGSDPSKGAYMYGDLASVIIYNRNLPDTERRSLINALSKHYFNKPATE